MGLVLSGGSRSSSSKGKEGQEHLCRLDIHKFMGHNGMCLQGVVCAEKAVDVIVR